MTARRGGHTALIALAFVVAAGSAVGPRRVAEAAGAPAAGKSAADAGDAPFLPPAQPLRVTIDELVAQSMRVKNDVTIRLADGSQRVTTRYTFTRLVVTHHMKVVHPGADGAPTVTIDVPHEGSLGGYDGFLQPQETVMWGDIHQVCLNVVVRICGVQGLLNAFGSVIPLTAGASDFDGTIYAIRATSRHPGPGNTADPVHLPGTITVTP
ncbi:hypothetical protein HUT11_04980 [Streptomyces seoulensis]|nr:hypothetical protein HUT11_04980 [Streptomyces seoulensis]